MKIEKDEVQIEVNKDIFKGNVLDIGFSNTGVIYNVYKHFNKDIEVEYICGKQDKNNIALRFYDSCVLFFTINNIWGKNSKGKLFKDVYEYLKDQGTIYLWDIDKGLNKAINRKVKVIMPMNEEKDIELKDFNIFKDSSKNSTKNIIEKYFDIIDEEEIMGIYFIKAKKKEKI